MKCFQNNKTTINYYEFRIIIDFCFVVNAIIVNIIVSGIIIVFVAVIGLESRRQALYRHRFNNNNI